MTWVVMPRVTRLLRGWLYPNTLLRGTSLDV
jgi:antibiotic biosynthesis monooxygenase (ABM) superfamily enzyme